MPTKPGVACFPGVPPGPGVAPRAAEQLDGATLVRVDQLLDAKQRVGPSPASAEIAFAGGQLEMHAPPEFEVWLDGRHLGTTPLGTMAVSEGRHELRFVHRGVSKDLPVRVFAGEITRIEVQLDADDGVGE